MKPHLPSLSLSSQWNFAQSLKSFCGNIEVLVVLGLLHSELLLPYMKEEGDGLGEGISALTAPIGRFAIGLVSFILNPCGTIFKMDPVLFPRGQLTLAMGSWFPF